MPFGELRRSLNLQLDVEVTPAMSIENRNALVLDLEDRSSLRAFGNLQGVFRFQCRDFNLGAQRRLGKRDRHSTIEIFPFALKELVLLGMQHDIEIARRTAKGSGFAFARIQDARTLFHSRRDFHSYRAFACDTAFAFAARARIDNQLARTLANRAGTRNREKSLLITDLSAASAGCAGDGRLARSQPGSVAQVALFVAANLHLFAGAEDGLLEFQCQIFPQIGAPLRARTAPSALLTEGIAETEDVAKDVLEIVEHRGIETAIAGRWTIAILTRMSETVIPRSLFAIDQHGIGFAALLELFFRLGIVRVAVGMVLQRQFAVGTLDLLLAGGTGNTQDFVVIAFDISSQSS